MSIVSVVITTFNEAANIERAVKSASLLSSEIVVIDSGSTDETTEIARRLGARVLTRPFDDMARQRNHVLDEGGLRGDYAMFMDADEMVTEQFARSLGRLLEREDAPDGVSICRRFHFWGVWVPAASSFPRYIDRVVRVGRVRFRKEGHGEVFEGGERYARLEEPLHDEDLKPVDFWIERHNRYARMEAREDIEAVRPGAATSRFRRVRARLRRLPGWPLVALGYYLFWRRGLLEGRVGWTYCTMKAMYEYFVQLHIRDLIRRGT